MLSDGRFWAGVVVGAGAVYGWLYWLKRKNGSQ